jgi:hypothetical protein
MFVLLGICSYAQTSPKVIAEISASSEKTVKGAPFSAEAVSESVQTLADGNRIVRKWTNKLYRNSEGRFRREGSGLPGSALGAYLSVEPSVLILDPVAGSRYMVDTDSKTVRAFALKTPIDVKVGTTFQLAVPAAKGESGLKIQTEVNAAYAAQIAKAAAEGGSTKVITAAPVAIGGTPAATAGWETRTESLGVQNFDGVDAEGTRTITTIPTDAIGNERPIEIVYERWYSKELQLIVYSKHSDPRFGDQTYRLTNIVRSEPDPSLFEIPNGYRIRTEPPINIYRPAQTKVATEKAVQVKVAAPAKP